MKAKQILSGIGVALTVIIFLVGLLVFGSALKAKKGEVPNLFGYSVLRIETGSMEPEFKTGSIVITKSVDTDTLKVGDVISFYSTSSDIDRKVNTHRIQELSYLTTGERQFITKGDANPTVDSEPVFYRRVIGKVVWNLGVVSGSVIGFLQKPTVILLFIILPLLVITFLEASNLVKLFMSDDESTEESDADEPSKHKKN